MLRATCHLQTRAVTKGRATARTSQPVQGLSCYATRAHGSSRRKGPLPPLLRQPLPAATVHSVSDTCLVELAFDMSCDSPRPAYRISAAVDGVVTSHRCCSSHLGLVVMLLGEECSVLFEPAPDSVLF